MKKYISIALNTCFAFLLMSSLVGCTDALKDALLSKSNQSASDNVQTDKPNSDSDMIKVCNSSKSITKNWPNAGPLEPLFYLTIDGKDQTGQLNLPDPGKCMNINLKPTVGQQIDIYFVPDIRIKKLSFGKGFKDIGSAKYESQEEFDSCDIVVVFASIEFTPITKVTWAAMGALECVSSNIE